jgi:SprT protein
LDKVKVLEKYLPPDAAPLIGRWIDYFKCEFKISRNRGTKFGDYRAPFDGKGHRISVNFDLNPYAFLVTTVHERICIPGMSISIKQNRMVLSGKITSKR